MGVLYDLPTREGMKRFRGLRGLRPAAILAALVWRLDMASGVAESLNCDRADTRSHWKMASRTSVYARILSKNMVAR